MLKLVLFYCLCQLVVQSFLYFGIRDFIKNRVFKKAYRNDWSAKQIIKRYNIYGLIVNSIITAGVIAVTARASMVGTANLLASTILTLFIYLDSNIIAFEYTKYKQKQDALKIQNKKKRLFSNAFSTIKSKIRQEFDYFNEPVMIPASLLKGDTK